MKVIKVRFDGIEKSPDGKFSIIYTPDNTQVLRAGVKYRIEVEGLTYDQSGEKAKAGRK